MNPPTPPAYSDRMQQISDQLQGNPTLLALHESASNSNDMRKWYDILYPRGSSPPKRSNKVAPAPAPAQ
jgi:hypothetical protein